MHHPCAREKEYFIGGIRLDNRGLKENSDLCSGCNGYPDSNRGLAISLVKALHAVDFPSYFTFPQTACSALAFSTQ